MKKKKRFKFKGPGATKSVEAVDIGEAIGEALFLDSSADSISWEWTGYNRGVVAFNRMIWKFTVTELG
jgi:hypothetical protein